MRYGAWTGSLIGVAIAIASVIVLGWAFSFSLQYITCVKVLGRLRASNEMAISHFLIQIMLARAFR